MNMEMHQHGWNIISYPMDEAKLGDSPELVSYLENNRNGDYIKLICRNKNQKESVEFSEAVCNSLRFIDYRDLISSRKIPEGTLKSVTKCLGKLEEQIDKFGSEISEILDKGDKHEENNSGRS